MANAFVSAPTMPFVFSTSGQRRGPPFVNGASEAGSGEPAAQHQGKRPRERGAGVESSTRHLAQHRRGLKWQAHRAQTEARADRHDRRSDERVQVKVQVCVAVIECQPAVGESRELRGDLRRELAARRARNSLSATPFTGSRASISA